MLIAWRPSRSRTQRHLIVEARLGLVSQPQETGLSGFGVLLVRDDVGFLEACCFPLAISTRKISNLLVQRRRKPTYLEALRTVDVNGQASELPSANVANHRTGIHGFYLQSEIDIFKFVFFSKTSSPSSSPPPSFQNQLRKKMKRLMRSDRMQLRAIMGRHFTSPIQVCRYCTTEKDNPQLRKTLVQTLYSALS
jgi:hypothetical protein